MKKRGFQALNMEAEKCALTFVPSHKRSPAAGKGKENADPDSRVCAAAQSEILRSGSSPMRNETSEAELAASAVSKALAVKDAWTPEHWCTVNTAAYCGITGCAYRDPSSAIATERHFHCLSCNSYQSNKLSTAKSHGVSCSKDIIGEQNPLQRY